MKTVADLTDQELNQAVQEYFSRPDCDFIEDPEQRDLLQQKILGRGFHLSIWPRPGSGVVGHFADGAGRFFKIECEFNRLYAEAILMTNKGFH